jgi:hypothetical protein
MDRVQACVRDGVEVRTLLSANARAMILILVSVSMASPHQLPSQHTTMFAMG